MIDVKQIKNAQEAWRLAVSAGEDSGKQSAKEAIVGCRNALIVLTNNLKQMDYPVKTYSTPCSRGLDARLNSIEKATGAVIPPVLKLFWRTIGGVSLVDLENYAHNAFWEEQGVYNKVRFSDGLYIEALSKDWAEYMIETFRDWQENSAEYGAETEPFLIDLSPDGYHKDDISGGPAYGILPGAKWNPMLENFAWAGPKRPETAPDDPCDFLSYLRTTILDCAGFPGFYGVPEFEPIKARLLAGVPVF